MNDKANMIFAQGAEFQTKVTVTAWPVYYPALNTATSWTLKVSKPDTAPFLTASSTGGSPYITLNVAGDEATIIIPAAVTATMPLGQARYDLDINFPASKVKRLISLGTAQVNTYVGAT
jgi:hypothetical protein